MSFLGSKTRESRVLAGALRSFVKRYGGFGGVYASKQSTYNVHDAHFRLDCLLAMLVRLKPAFQLRQMNFSDLDLLAFEKNLQYVIRYAISEMCCYFKALCKCFVTPKSLCYYNILGGVSEDAYPGPIRLRAFLKAYSLTHDFAIQCYSPDAPLSGPLVTNDENTVLANYKGLAIISYRSTVTYESSLFSSPFRGYLIVFQYTLIDGPLTVPLTIFTESRLYDYTSDHMVSCILNEY